MKRTQTVVTKRNASRDDAGTFVQQARVESVQSVTPVHTARLAPACRRCKEIPMLLAHQVRINVPNTNCSSSLVPELYVALIQHFELFRCIWTYVLI